MAILILKKEKKNGDGVLQVIIGCCSRYVPDLTGYEPLKGRKTKQEVMRR